MGLLNTTRKPKMGQHIADASSREAAPLARVPFKESRAALNAYLKSKGDMGGWKRSRPA